MTAHQPTPAPEFPEGASGRGELLFDRAKATRLMDAAGIDLLLPNTYLNAGYLSDYYFYNVANWPYYLTESQAHWQYFVGLPGDSGLEPFLLGSTGGNATDLGLRDPWIKDRYLFGPTDPEEFRVRPSETRRAVSATVLDAVAMAIHDRRLDRSTIGVEMPFLGASLLAGLQARLPHARFVDAIPLFNHLRLIKSPEEVRRMQVACDGARRTHLRVNSHLREGLSGYDIDRLVNTAIAEQGLVTDFREIHPNRDGVFMFAPSPLRVKRGEPITLDVGCKYLNYVSDMARNHCVGEPDAKIVDLHRHMKEAFYAVMESLRPGVECADLFAIGQRELVKSGYPLSYGMVGHGLGRDIHETPVLSAEDHTVLEAGMVLTIELPMFVPGVGSVQIEDDFLITESGYRWLAPSSVDILRVA